MSRTIAARLQSDSGAFRSIAVGRAAHHAQRAALCRVPFAASIGVSTALGLFIFDTTVSALIKDFGGRSRRRFWDSGYTHPNFERRLLVMQHELAPTEQSAELLRQFDEDREAAGKARTLYRGPGLRLFEKPPGEVQEE